jgi:N-acetylglutamate synthase-like GNAT family acetyltransferase
MTENRGDDIHIESAAHSDADRIAAFLSEALVSEGQVTPEDVQAHLRIAGILLAEVNGELVGLLGWQVEHLIARVTDFLITPARFRFTAGRALVAAMEETGYELQCDVAILLVHSSRVQEALAFWQDLGYGLHDIAGLPQSWKEAAQEAGFDLEDQALIKRLRQDSLLSPL